MGFLSYTHTYIYIYIYVCMYVYINMYIYIYVYIYMSMVWVGPLATGLLDQWPNENLPKAKPKEDGKWLSCPRPHLSLSEAPGDPS